MFKQFGQFLPDGGEGYLRPVYFPSLATMDEWTPDGRMILSEGAGTRTLPRPIMAQFQTIPGHFEAHAVGSLQEVTFHEDGNISGKGWLADVPMAHLLVTLMQTKSLFHNSVDLADVEYEADWESDDPDDPGFWNLRMKFTKSNIGATTFVNIPAFPDAHGSLDAPTEVTASLEPLEVTFGMTGINFELAEDEEITAASKTMTAESFAAFHRAEPTVLTKHTVDENGDVYGHLAPWNQCHDGVAGRCVIAPRPSDYSAFHQGSVLTEHGLVDTGVIFFLGGHPDKPLGQGDAHKAYGGVENAWAKVRVVNGALGPWYSGRIMSGLSPEAIELARATGISGHWRTDDTLAAIISVNVRGFNVPGTDRTFDKPGASVGEDGRRHDLVASLGHVPDAPPITLSDAQRDALAQTIIAKMNATRFVSTAATFAATETDELSICTSEPRLADELELLAIEMETELELEAAD